MVAQNPFELISAHAHEDPHRTAMFSSRLTMDYATFIDTVQRVAAKLRSVGLRPNQVVGLKLDAELHAVFTAAVLHEAAVGFAVTRSILENYADDIDVVISDSHDWQGVATKLIVIDEQWLAGLAAINKNIEPNLFDSEESLALLVFSSGTTGVPKGVEFTIADIHRRTKAASVNWMPVEPFFSELGLDTVSGIQTFYYCLMQGKTYFVSINATTNVQVIQEAEIRSIKTSPAKLAALVAQATANNSRLGGLQQVQVAGGLLSPVVARELAEVSDATVVYLYGSTEAGTVTRGVYDPHDPECVGEIVFDAEVRITDETGLELPVGAAGELRMRTPYQAKRYWRSDLTSSTGFRDGWFVPGDTGVIEAGNTLRVTGRVDELVNSAGIKLNPAVIDSKLLGYRGVADLAAFAYTAKGEIHKSLGIAVVTESEISMDRFRDRVLELVPDIHDLVIVRVSEIPRNALGKPLRTALAKKYESHVLD
jgi:acyl-coenzyme A synthetase/AMP-(fatty) acid ligase